MIVIPVKTEIQNKELDTRLSRSIGTGMIKNEGLDSASSLPVGRQVRNDKWDYLNIFTGWVYG